MNVLFAIIFIVGASAFAIWSILGLIGAIKDRKAKRNAKPSDDGEAVEERHQEDE